MASDDIYIKLHGLMVHILVTIKPSWKQYVVYEGENRVTTIYSETNKAIYDIVDASKIFFNTNSFRTQELVYSIFWSTGSCIPMAKTYFISPITIYREFFISKCLIYVLDYD